MKCPFCGENLIEGDMRCPHCRCGVMDFDYFENMDKMEKSIPKSLFWTYLVKN
ncbi:hypothetical protein [Methanobrevibacter millerae]|uniref:Zinc-ribbon domain-containing protein n=1 Tax=Methanobrevibacter millerae TaxID=230361 RepID=A0A0U3CXD7_9EURY|nr:hypothetical protein [Methanobrevibacter millerae]ALT68996.1 hypothetical protein sm9_1215 [Methanobrevibacter millerae]